MPGLSIIKLHLIFVIDLQIDFVKIYKLCSWGMRNILSFGLLCVIHFYYYFQTLGGFLSVEFPQILMNCQKIIALVSLHFSIVLLKYILWGYFFLFSVLASLWCFCISFTTTTWQLTKVKKEGGDTSSFFQTDSYFLCEFEQISLLLHVCFHICTAGVNFPWAL